MKGAEYWIRKYREKGAFWIHNGSPRRPHAILTSEKHGGKRHSSGFFNSELVMEDPLVLDKAAFDLTRLLEKSGLRLNGVDRVVGPAMGAITLVHDVARRIGSSRSCPRPCLRAYAEKGTDTGGDRIFLFRKSEIRRGERVLLIDDVFTTGQSVNYVVKAVTRAGGTVLPFIGSLVNRSGLDEVDGRKIVALVTHPMPMWPPENCSLCKSGSRALLPKENWAVLNA